MSSLTLPTSLRFPAILLAAATALAGLTGCDKGGSSPGAAAPSGGEDGNTLVGGPAPDFALDPVVGKKVPSLAAAKGKVVLVDFWATWCGPCKASFPKWQALSKEFGDDVVVIGISEDDDKDGIPDFLKETGATFAIGWDQDKSIASSYKPGTMPTAFIIDKNGLVRFVHAGFRAGDEGVIKGQIKSLL
jgi:thiol-disulfide isomerase/thioredoxin